MAAVNEDALRETLRSEGFRRVYVWQDGPSAYYPEHTHPTFLFSETPVHTGTSRAMICRSCSGMSFAGSRFPSFPRKLPLTRQLKFN